ncbi:MAG: DUF4954 family protein, partial [Odoribacter sp.]|nr:DUF4954 family protein [Odoribacter sp.]
MRKLTNEEVAKLTHQGCTAEDWRKIEVSEDFVTEGIADVHFSGHIRLGRFTREHEMPWGMRCHSGIRHVRMHECSIGDNVLMENIKYVANYDIEEGCVVEDIYALVTEGRSAFGNGVRITVLNETGGREVTIFNELSAHLAYMAALYRYEGEMTRRVEEMAETYTAKVSSERGRIGRGTRISHAGILKNIAVGHDTVIEGATRLENGTLKGQAYMGSNVIAKNFIVCENTRVTNGANLEHCFVGQGCEIGCMFSAHDSLFFSNCHMENGEACAVLAAPYSVSMHKSTLLIGGMFSFLNAGSGSNQSNHLYRLGAVHQGIMERGCKLGSDSYVKWPAHVGAFSVMTGRHTEHMNSSILPFSYLIGEEGVTWLVPGVCLRTAGTRRDAAKWRERDKRPETGQLDYIHFDLLNPYTAGRMMAGMKVLENLLEKGKPEQEVFVYEGMRIRRKAAEKGIVYYKTGIRKFLGDALIKRLKERQFKSEEELKDCLRPEYLQGRGEWTDLAGIIVPRREVERLVNDIKTG